MPPIKKPSTNVLSVKVSEKPIEPFWQTAGKSLVRLYHGNILYVLKGLPAKSVQCTVTSPPYWGLRNYEPQEWFDSEEQARGWACSEANRCNKFKTFGGTTRYIAKPATHSEQRKQWLGAIGIETLWGDGSWCAYGSEKTPDEFVEHTVEIFREVYRVLRDDGTLWLNFGDSYTASPPGNKTPRSDRGWSEIMNAYSAPQDEARMSKRDTSKSGLPSGNLVGIPWRVALALQADGWVLRQDIIWCLSGGTWVYARTLKGDMPMLIRDMARLKPGTVQLWNGEKWTKVLGMSVSQRKGDEIEIVLRSGERISCTPNHEFPVVGEGLVDARNLTVGQQLERCILGAPDNPREPKHIGLDAAWFAGLYLAEGCGALSEKIQISGNVLEVERWNRVKRIVSDYGGYCTLVENGNNQTIRIYGKLICSIVRELVTGTDAKTKGIAPVVWRYSNEFVRSFMYGYLSGDGNADPKNNRWRLGFTRNYNLERDIRVACARLGWVLTLNTTTSTCNGQEFPSFRGEIRETQPEHRNSKSREEIVEIRKARCREVYDIGVEDEPHTFSLASGILTHNCKPSPMPESIRNRCTKAHEYVFLLTKNGSGYFYDQEAVREEAIIGYRIASEGHQGFRSDGYTNNNSVNNSNQVEATLGKFTADKSAGRNKRSVWTVDDESTLLDWLAVNAPEQLESYLASLTNKPDVWKVASQGYEGAHFACVDSETEALTPNGWKTNSQLVDGDLIAAYDLQSDTIKWQSATFHRYPFNGELVSFDKRDTSQRLTPNHRCLIKSRKGKVQVRRADAITSRNQFLMAAPFEELPEMSIGVDMACLIGWYTSEGWKGEKRKINICQSMSANPNHVQEIELLLRRLNARFETYHRYSTYKGSDRHDVVFSIRGRVAEAVLKLCPGKAKPISNVLTRLPNPELEAILLAFIRGDGHTRPDDGRMSIVQKSKARTEQLQIIALKLGYRCHMAQRKEGTYALYLTKGRWLLACGSSGKWNGVETVAYNGIVWCPKVASGFWLARREGKPFITGNTFPPKAD